MLTNIIYDLIDGKRTLIELKYNALNLVTSIILTPFNNEVTTFQIFYESNEIKKVEVYISEVFTVRSHYSYVSDEITIEHEVISPSILKSSVVKFGEFLNYFLQIK